ncbi:class I SAM-dependent methyltransferase [Persephonella sp.]
MVIYDPRSPKKDFDYYLVRYRYKVLLPKFKKGNIAIELGCGTGLSLKLLSKLYEKIIVIEKDERHIKEAQKFIKEHSNKFIFIKDDWMNLPKVIKDCTSGCFDIVFFEGLEYLSKENTKQLLKSIKYGAKDFRLHIVVSNKYSFHRRLGFYMSILDDMDSLKNASAIASEKIWLADRYLLLSILRNSGYNVIHIEPHFFKILPNKYLQRLPEDIIKALFEIGKELPDYCAEIYVCAEPE